MLIVVYCRGNNATDKFAEVFSDRDAGRFKITIQEFKYRQLRKANGSSVGQSFTVAA